MKSCAFLLSCLFGAVFAVSCDKFEWEMRRWNNADPEKGTKELSSVDLAYFSDEDKKTIITLLGEGKKPEYRSYGAITFISPETIKEATALYGNTIGSEQALRDAMALYGLDSDSLPDSFWSGVSYGEGGDSFVVKYANAVSLPTQEFRLCRVTYEPVEGKITDVKVESSDSSVVTVEHFGLGDGLLDYVMTAYKPGECDLTMTVKGIGTYVRHYHVIVTYNLDMVIQVDPFWEDSGQARVKWLTENASAARKRNISLGGRYVTHGRFVGVCRKIDMRTGKNGFIEVRDSVEVDSMMRRTTLSGAKSMLRDFSSAAQQIIKRQDDCYIKVSDQQAKLDWIEANIWENRPENALAWWRQYDVVKEGRTLYLNILGNSIPISEEDAEWINHNIERYGRWPDKSVNFVVIDGVEYLVVKQHWQARQLKMFFGFESDFPYLSYTPKIRFRGKDSDEESFTVTTDEDGTQHVYDKDGNLMDVEFLFDDQGQLVVDGLEHKFQDYFLFNFSNYLK